MSLLTGASRTSFWGLVASAAVIAGYIGLSLAGWWGAPDPCIAAGNCFCEAGNSIGTAFPRQPVNSWSTVPAMVAGLLVLLAADRERRATSLAPNPMASGGPLAVFYGGLMLWLALGSIAFHGSLSRVGGWLDTLSLIMFMMFVLLYDLSRIGRWNDAARFLGLYALTNVPLAVASWSIDGSGTIIFGVLVVVAVSVNVVILVARPGGVRREATPWFVLTVATFALATIVWRLSWSGAPLCDPASALQGHAIWHVLAMAATPLWLFLYLRTESRTPHRQRPR